MNIRYVVAAFAYLLLLLAFHTAEAASPGPYDGEWKGTAKSTGDRCKHGAAVSLTVEGRVVLGQATVDGDTQRINGAVDGSGAVGATIGFQYLKGRFSGDEFEGTFTFSDCQWEAVLKRMGGADHDRTATSGSRY